MTLSLSQVIQEHVEANTAAIDTLLSDYLGTIDKLYEDAELDDNDVVSKLKQLSTVIADDSRLDLLTKTRDWILTYIFVLCRDITE